MPQLGHSEACLCQVEQSQCSQFFLLAELLHPSDCPGASSGFAPTAPHPSCAGGQTWIQNSRWDFPGAEEKGCENLNKAIPFPGAWNSVPANSCSSTLPKFPKFHVTGAPPFQEPFQSFPASGLGLWDVSRGSRVPPILFLHRCPPLSSSIVPHPNPEICHDWRHTFHALFLL